MAGINFPPQLMSKTGGLPSWKMTLATDMFFWQKATRSLIQRSLSITPTNCSTIARNQNKEKVIVISGPTGAGKSRLALELAKRLDGEVISADSVQVYRGLDVGSAKPSVAEQREVPHHLIDILNPFEEYSAGKFFEDARKITQEVLSRGKVPLVAGGTGLYLRWYIYGKPDVPKASSEVSIKVWTELMQLHEEGKWGEAVKLAVNAGDTKAQSLPLNNWYRLRRSLEIIRSSGSPPSAFAVPYDSFKDQTAFEDKNVNTLTKDLDYDFLCLFLTSPRIHLYRAIDLRCEEMLMETDGLLSEASWLLDIGLQQNMNSATRAIGYSQAMEYLLECRNHGGKSTAECFHAFLYEFQKVSRNFAKRQMTWFRNDFMYHRIDASRPLGSVADFVCSAYNEQTEKLVVPKHLQMKNDVNNRQENNEMKSYRPKNRIFTGESDCVHVLDWVWRTQRRLIP